MEFFVRQTRLWILTLILLLVSAAARADQVDDFVRAQMKVQNIPGLSLVDRESIVDGVDLLTSSHHGPSC